MFPCSFPLNECNNPSDHLRNLMLDEEKLDNDEILTVMSDIFVSILFYLDIILKA